MKMKTSIKPIAFALLTTLFVVSCSDDDDAPGIADNNIVNTADADSELTIFSEALELTDLDDVLASAGTNYTVLAPTNSAFEGISLSDFETSDLRTLLLNHVIIGNVTSADLTASGSGYSTTEATAGPADSKVSIYYDTANNTVRFNNTATVSQADIPATNGVIHKVDNIISIPDVTTFVIADSNLSALESALADASLVTALQAENGEGTPEAPFTIFAPDNAAFNDLETVPTGEDLSNVLQYHVAAQANVRSSQLSDGDLNTLTGTVTIDASAATVKGAGNASASAITTVDIQASNGVIHIIDEVLLPAM